MNRTSRALAAVVAASALTFTGVHTADAKPDHAGSHAKAGKATKAAKGSTSKLERVVTRKLAQLDRTVTDQRLRRLDPEHVVAVRAHVEADKDALEALLAPADPATTEGAAAEPTDARTVLRTYRVENYRLAVNILRQAAQAGDTTDAETTAVDGSVTLALTITATSTKAEVRAARAAFQEAAGLLDDDADEAKEAAETEGDDDAGTEDDTDTDTVTP